MQFTTVATFFIAAAGVVSANPVVASSGSKAAPPNMPPPAQVTDLASCMKYAKEIPNEVASKGWQNGCQNQFGDGNAKNVSARAIESSLDAGLFKRCKSEHDSCCCQSFCLDEVSCPVCIAGCEASCVAQYGGDCTGGGSDCGGVCN